MKVVLFCLALTSLASAGIEVTVDPSTGLTVARDAIRARRKAGETGPAAILVPGGKLECLTPLVLEPVDSDLTIRPVGDAEALLIGGTPVTAFTPFQGQIVKADLTAWGKPGTALRQLLFGGERMPLARYPNVDSNDPLYGGWAFVDALPTNQPDPARDPKSMFTVRPADLRHWAHPEDVEVDIFPQYGWWNFVLPVKSLDPTTRTLTTAKPSGYVFYPNNRFHFQNAMEELDAPGEWFLDPRTRILYFWPPASQEGKETRLITLESFIQIKPGTKKIKVEKLSFTGCNGNAISVINAEDCVIAGCQFHTTCGLSGTAISFGGGRNNLAQSNDITLCGGSGISLTGGDRITLTAANHRAVNNHIRDFGIYNKNACGVGASGAGITISHNLIHNGPRMGVQMSGNNITVEYNHLHHLCQETQDGAAIYTGGRDWLGGRGDIWRYNRIHDIIGCGQEPGGLKHPWFTFGLYPDDNTGGVDIIGNLVYRVAQSPIHMHNSRDCLVENNIFAFGGFYQFDLHGWRKEHGPYIRTLPEMITGYESVANQPAWKMMRGMELHPKDAIRDDGTMMSGDIVRRNIMFSGGEPAKYSDLRNASSKWNTIDENLTWNGGQPVRTGITRAGKDLGAPIFQESFANVTPPAEAKIPSGWGFNNRANTSVAVSLSQGALWADCVRSDDPRNSHTTFHGPNLPLSPGKAYRIRLKVKSTLPSSPFAISLAAYKDKEGYWQSRAADFTATSDWQDYEAAASIPERESALWKPFMTSFWLRIDCNGPEGQIGIDDVSITEAEVLDEWKSWQREGWDQHSIVADPLFENAAKDDFRLKSESPAIKQLGFKPLPIDEMGLVEDAWRHLPRR